MLAVGAFAAGSASASYIVYVCGPNLCEVNPDGTGQRALTSDGGGAAGSYSTPSLSRDGTLLSFDKGNGAYAMTMPGGAPTQLEAGSVLATFTRPEGTEVAFMQDVLAVPTLFTVTPAGGGRSEPLEGRAALTAGWLGPTLLRDGNSSTAHNCNPPGTNCPARSICPATNETCGSPVTKNENVAEDPLRDLYDPAGSPDGTKVAAMAVPYPEGSEHPSPTGGAIALYSASTAQHILDLTSGSEDSGPAWSPDGSEIAFTRGSSSIYIVPAGGGSPRLLLTGGIQPTWGGGPGDTLSGAGSGSSPGSTTPATAGSAQAAAGALAAKGTSVSVSLSCGAGSGGCTVALVLTVSETLRGHSVVALGASSHPRISHRTVVVGRASVTLAPGQARSVTVSLNGTGSALLKSHGKLLVKVSVTQAGRLLRTVKLTLHRPARKH